MKGPRKINKANEGFTHEFLGQHVWSQKIGYVGKYVTPECVTFSPIWT